MPFRRHKPEWIYELLPWLYVGAGVVTMAAIRNLMSVLSGLMLVSAGFSVWQMRRRSRKAGAKEQPVRSSESPRLPGGAGLMQLVWRSSYECGDPLIDDQHRRLFELGNELVNALLDGEPKADVEVLIDGFVEHIVDHFNTEEALMSQNHDPVEREHREVHHKLLERAKQLNRRFHRSSGEQVVRDLVSFIAYDVVAQHLILEDPKIAHVALGRHEDRSE